MNDEQLRAWLAANPNAPESAKRWRRMPAWGKALIILLGVLFWGFVVLLGLVLLVSSWPLSHETWTLITVFIVGWFVSSIVNKQHQASRRLDKLEKNLEWRLDAHRQDIDRIAERVLRLEYPVEREDDPPRNSPATSKK